MVTLDDLQTRGFDRSVRDTCCRLTVRCSQCEALVINGVPAHELGCPNRRHSCKGCDAIVPARQRYCEECQV